MKTLRLATACFIVLAFATLAQANALKEIDLASDTAWTLSIDGNSPARPIRVPGGGWNSDRQQPQIPSASVKDHVVYERELVVPAAARGKVVKVEFGGCNYGAEVFLDDRKVAEHHAPMTPFAADLTGLVEAGKTYRLRVKAYSRFHYGKFGQPTVGVTAGFDFNKGMSRFSQYDGHTKYAYGLTGHVRLAIYPAVYISDVFVRTSVENRALAYDVWVTNGSQRSRTMSVNGALAPWRGKVPDYPDLPPRAITVKAGETRKVTVQGVGWNLGAASYWWPNIQFHEDYAATLHWLNLSLEEDGKVVHRRRQRFGFVEYREGPYYYTVNGVRFTSISDSNSYGQVGEYDCWSQTPCFLPPDGTYKGCPETWKRYQRIGFNSMRLSTSVPTRYMLETADEAGYMLIPEGGSWGNGTCTFDKESFSGQLQGMMRVCRNHPSVARYSMANESTQGDGGEWRWLIDAAIEADPTRPYVFEVNPGRGVGPMKGMQAGHAYRMQHYEPIVQGGDFIRGMGECCWSTNGMKPFAKAAREFRMKDWAHFAPWSWLNFWPNFLEGMSHQRHPWKQANHADRQDGVDGWDSPLVTYMQKSLHPYLLLDHQMEAVNSYDPNWPTVTPYYASGANIERKIEVFNDSLSEGRFVLRWTAHWDTPTGPQLASGQTEPQLIEPGFHATKTIRLKAPKLDVARRKLFLVTESVKDGQVVFREDRIYFNMANELFPPEATFVGTDAQTQGNYSQRYGADGGQVFGEPAKLPPETMLHIDGATWVWEKTTSDPRALMRMGDNSKDNRILACRYHGDQLTLTLDVGEKPRRVALYFADADRRGRTQTVEIRNLMSPSVILDTRRIKEFIEGKYLIWNIHGAVQVSIQRTGPGNAVLGGVFFDPPNGS